MNYVHRYEGHMQVKPEGWNEESCWLCGGFKRVEFTWVDENEEVKEGVYDPCPQCEKG
ncbi:hypothetical protein [Paenibacillus alkalitolerans]|uniref:hypothetical protein n=1 Tax=Paenibacillus alkalitolerans TaxID=2799335 RepID=UPI0018F5F2E2|nr:hypothetical protein [Paenibacillus alkalitolerans]